MHNVKEKLTFIEINPGLGSFGFAAEAAGMLRLGPVLLSCDVRDAYVAFHGADSDTPVADVADLVVADLPFTMFLDGKNADPEVTDIIEAAKAAVRKNGVAMFRVKWDIGERLAMAPDEYAAVVRGIFPKYAVSHFTDASDASDPVSSRDLYIVASPFDLSPGDLVANPGAVTAIHALRLDDPNLSNNDPQLILDALGFPEDFLGVAGTVPDIHERLRECVAIRRAKVVLEFVASHIQG